MINNYDIKQSLALAPGRQARKKTGKKEDKKAERN
jgi:hypothetical protein